MTGYLLVDCNNFFVSCERLFDPSLIGKPTIVLSNNDGCVVSRSYEARAVGIPMGIPLFKIPDLIERYNVQVRSSNFALYGDISNRIMTELENFTNELEIYSIDEAFLKLKFKDINSFHELGENIITKIKKNIGIPVSVGIAHSKTLSKIANEYSKSHKKHNCTTNLLALSDEQLDSVLNEIDIKDIWGIGLNRTLALNKMGIYNALQLKKSDRMLVKKNLGINGERTYLELNKIACFNEMISPISKKSISSTRSFGRAIKSKDELRQAVSSYTEIAARKLRKSEGLASAITVYIRTNKFDPATYYSNAFTVEFYPSDVSKTLIKYALSALDKVYIENKAYKKAGIYLTNITNKDNLKLSYLGNNSDTSEKDSKLQKAIDKINYKFGDEILHFAVSGFKKDWQVKKDMSSKHFTTSWNGILEVKI